MLLLSVSELTLAKVDAEIAGDKPTSELIEIKRILHLIYTWRK
jgi:hypothetical protein